MKKKKTLTVYLEDEILEKLKEKAKKNALSISSYVRSLIAKDLEEKR